jgi:NADH dehydrogenase
VRAVEPDRLLLDDGDEVPSELTVWCGGFAAPPLARAAGIAVDHQGAVLTDTALRSVSHPAVLAVGDAGHAPGPDGDRYSMSCQFAFPSAAHAADLLRAELLLNDGRMGSHDSGAALDLGFTARAVSLGRHHAVLQPTTRDDVAEGRAWTGRAAVLVKWFQVRGVVATIGIERRIPGAIRWPHADQATHEDAQPVAG